MPARSIFHRAALSLLCVLLTSCAGQQAFREGKDFIAQNRIEDGLQKFQQAMQADPGSAQYKSAWLQTRERAVTNFISQAERQPASQAAAAQALYKRVLALEPNNARAQAGLQALEGAQRHQLWLQQAQGYLAKKDYPAAIARIDDILLENPNHMGALQLQASIRELNKAAPAQSQLAAAFRKPITIEFRDATIKQVFEVIARSAGLNILFDKDVRQDQRMSIILKNSTIEAAIHYALMTNQLEQQVLDGNTILIYPNLPAKLKEYQEVVVRSFFLSNAEAKAVANSIKTLVKSRDIVVDEKLNMIILRDSPEAIRIAEKIVALHDQAEPEVMLEVEVLEVKRTRLLDLGIQWPQSMSLTVLPPSGSSSAGPSTGSTTSGTLTLNDVLTNINSRTVQASLGSATVNIRKNDSDVNLLANPRIRARNHEKAKILIGERVPNITSTSTSTGFVSESVNYVDVGLKLEVEPSIFLDNDVGIKVALEVSNIVSESQTKSGTTAYRIGTRTANTVLRLKDGETQVLAGLLNDEERRSGNKVPGLGDLPIVGRLFGSSNESAEKTEIVLSITPHLIRNIQRPEAALAEFKAGTDGSMRVRPEASAAVMVLPSNRSNAAINNRAPNAAQNPAQNTAPSNAANTSPALAPSSSAINATSATSASPSINSSTSVNPSPATGATTALETGSAPPAPTPPQIQWQGPPNVKVGDNFSVQLVMRSDQAIASLPLGISYDSKVLQVTGVEEGDFLKQGGVQTNFSSKIDPSGKIIVTSTRATGGATDSGAIVTLNFRALKPADNSLIQLLYISPVTANNQGTIISLPAPYAVQLRP